MRSAGGNHRTLKKYVALWNIPVDHFDPYATQRRGAERASQPFPLSKILVEHSTYNRGRLKERLYREGLKARACELCGQGEEWRGRRMGLILDHINGVADDHRLENLQIVCPNCAATLDTHCGRQNRKERRCRQCDEVFQPRTSGQTYCSRRCGRQSPGSRAARSASRKVARPPYAQLVREVHALGWSAVGRRYGVSDNAVRKWVRQYERERDVTRGEEAA
ncbi:MAG TPA: HNH endonuclease signature motif containing protein [Baekduia sp.]|nr:HNH endonuclease signature motif containing protein [Baekduia sp.]